MRRRRGRPRKSGARERNGRVQRQAETPRQIAARMPHRRGLGEKATDQRAETELGRLVLRGHLDATLGLAGETYLALWRGYVWTLAGPRELAQGGGIGFTCDGCAVARHCRCWFRRKVFEEAFGVLLGAGKEAARLVHLYTVADVKFTVGDLEPLQMGLQALASYFGLTPRGTVVSQKISIGTAPPPA